MAEFHVKTSEAAEKQGPFTKHQVKQLAESGQLAPDHLLSIDNGNSWNEARRFSGLEFAPPVLQLEDSPPPSSIAAKDTIPAESAPSSIETETKPILPSETVRRAAEHGMQIAVTTVRQITSKVRTLLEEQKLKTSETKQPADSHSVSGESPVPPRSATEQSADADDHVAASQEEVISGLNWDASPEKRALSKRTLYIASGTALLSVLLCMGCPFSSSVDEHIYTGADPNSSSSGSAGGSSGGPVESFEQVVAKIREVAETPIRRIHKATLNDGKVFYWKTETGVRHRGGVSYDIEETDSLVNPITAKITVFVYEKEYTRLSFQDGPFVDRFYKLSDCRAASLFEATGAEWYQTYSFKNGKWVVLEKSSSWPFRPHKHARGELANAPDWTVVDEDD